MPTLHPLHAARETRGAISDLALVVVAPAPDATIRSHRTRVTAAGSDFGDVVPIQRRDLLWIQHRANLGTVSDLAGAVVAPAPDATIRSHRTRVGIGTDSGDVVPIQLRNLLWLQHRANLGTVSDLATPVGAPAPDATIRSHRTRVIATGSDFGDVVPILQGGIGGYLKLRDIQRRDLRRHQHRANLGTVSDLAVVVVPPAPDPTIRSHRTRVGITSSDSGDVVPNQRRDLLWLQHRANLGTVSDLADAVGAPAPDATIRSHRTRVIATGTDSGDHDRLRNLGLHRRQHVVTRGTVSDKEPAGAPAPDATIRSNRTRVIVAASADLGELN